MLKDIKDAKEISCYDALTGRYTGEEDGWQKWKDLDEDTSYEKEDIIIKDLKERLKHLDLKFDIKNEKRVHIWYNEKYKTNRKEYQSVEDAISKWGTTITCLGVRMENNKLIVCAPYGLNDLFNLILRPVKIDFTKEDYEKKVTKWTSKWELLKVIRYDE